MEEIRNSGGVEVSLLPTYDKVSVDVAEPEGNVEEDYNWYEHDISMKMLRDGANFVSSNPSDNARDCLYHLAQRGDFETLQMLFGLVSVGLGNVKTPNNITPLHYASNYRVARSLLANGANPDIVDVNGYSPLMLFLYQAASNYQYGVSNEQNHALWMAMDCFRLSDIKSYSDEQKSYIFSLISNSPFLELVKTYPNSHYLSENIGLRIGKTFRDSYDTELQLVDNKIKLITEKEMQPLLEDRIKVEKIAIINSFAAELPSTSQAIEILKSKIRPNSLYVYYSETDVINWTATGALWCLNPLLEDEYGQYPSHHLAVNGNIEALEMIIENIEEESELYNFLNKLDYEGNSPLHLAAYNGNLEVMSLLLEHYDTSILSVKNLSGDSPLDLIFGNEELVEKFNDHNLIRTYEYELLQEEKSQQEIDVEIEKINLERERSDMERQLLDSELYNQQIRADEKISNIKLAGMSQEDVRSMDTASSSTSFSGGATLSKKTLKAQQRKAELQRKKAEEEQRKNEKVEKEQHQKEIEQKRRGKLKEHRLDHMMLAVVEISTMIEAREELPAIGKRLSKVLKEAGILEIRRFFNYFGENKALLVRSLAESNFHDPRLLLAVVDGFDFASVGGSELLNHSIVVALERFQSKPVSEYSEPEKLHLLNSLAFIRVLSHKVSPDEDSHKLLGNLFSHLKVRPDSINAEKFLSEPDSNCSSIVSYVGYTPSKGSKPSEYHYLLVAILSSVEKLPEKSKDIEDAMLKTLIKFFVTPDISEERKNNPISPFALELFKARFNCNVASFKYSGCPLSTIAATNSVLLEYLLDEGCHVNFEEGAPEEQPLWHAAKEFNLDSIRLLKMRDVDLTKCPGIEDMVNREFKPNAAKSIISVLREKPGSRVLDATVSNVAAQRQVIAGGSGSHI